MIDLLTEDISPEQAKMIALLLERDARPIEQYGNRRGINVPDDAQAIADLATIVARLQANGRNNKNNE